MNSGAVMVAVCFIRSTWARGVTWKKLLPTRAGKNR
jgi:hypothetical protein